MMKKKKGSLALVALLVASVNCILQPTKDDLISKFHCDPTYKNSFPLCIYLHFTCYFIYNISKSQTNSKDTKAGLLSSTSDKNKHC